MQTRGCTEGPEGETKGSGFHACLRCDLALQPEQLACLSRVSRFPANKSMNWSISIPFSPLTSTGLHHTWGVRLKCEKVSPGVCYLGEEHLLCDSVAVKGPIYLIINSAVLCFYLSVILLKQHYPLKLESPYLCLPPSPFGNVW